MNKFFDFQRKKITPVSLIRISENDELTKILFRFLKKVDFKDIFSDRDCYAISITLSSFSRDITYVEGYYCRNVPIQHAWCCYKNEYYFDFLLEFILRESPQKFQYFKIIEKSGRDVFDLVKDSQRFGGHIFDESKK